MSACNFEFLLQFVQKQLDLDRQLEVFDHLGRCDICRDAVCQISRDLDGVLIIFCENNVKPNAMRRHINTARSGRAQMSANAFGQKPVRRSSKRLQ